MRLKFKYYVLINDVGSMYVNSRPPSPGYLGVLWTNSIHEAKKFDSVESLMRRIIEDGLKGIDIVAVSFNRLGRFHFDLAYNIP